MSFCSVTGHWFWIDTNFLRPNGFCEPPVTGRAYGADQQGLGMDPSLSVYAYVCVCARTRYIVLCSYITCVGSCTHHNNQGIRQLHHHKDSLCCPFITTPPYPPLWSPTPTLIPCNHQSFLSNVVISRMLYNLGWCGSVDWAPVCELKGFWFDSQLGHMTGLWATFPVGGMWEATAWSFSPSLSPSLHLSLKINK